MWSKVQGGFALAKAHAALIVGHIAHDRIFGHLDDDVWWSVNTTAWRRHAVLQRVLPSLPDENAQIRFIGNSGDAALLEAFRAYQLIRTLAARAGRPVTRRSIILDFGCGWGRILRFFLRDVPAAQLHGIDVMPQAIEISQKTNPWCQFVLGSPLPPSDLPAEGFDLIYMYSVFSHLSEDAHARWLDEFGRVLRPGGLLVATTWPREYIARCERARQGDTRQAHHGSLGAFLGTDGWLAAYDRGEFCHSPVGGGDELASDFYGESCIPEAYVRKHWASRFEIVNYLEADDESLWQNLIVAKRK